MPQSLSRVLIHITFSTKERSPMIDESVSPELNAYLATVTRNLNCECYRVGGIPDHVHLALRLSRTIAIANLVEKIKSSSSKWLKSKSQTLSGFAWQRGYGAFSVGQNDLDKLIAYIESQPVHHRTRTFQEEYRALLEECGIEYDERYIWD